MEFAYTVGSGGGGGINVRVVLRVRPMNPKELVMAQEERYDARGNKMKDFCVDFTPSDKTAITIFTQVDKLEKNSDPYEKHPFNFDYVFDCDTGQQQVYEVAAKPTIEGKHTR